MKKFIIAVMCICGCMVFAGAPAHRYGGPHGGHGPGPAPRYHHHGGHRNDGVWLAAGITGIVANGLRIVNEVAAPARTIVVTQPAANVVTPVYQEPVTPVVTTPVYTTPMYTTPVPTPVYYRQDPVVYYNMERPVYYRPAPRYYHYRPVGAPAYRYGW